MGVIRVPELLSHVLKNPKSYPGPHNEPQERTSKGFQKLDTRRQTQLIFDAVLSRLAELLDEGSSVSIPGFGVFSFAVRQAGHNHGPTLITKIPTFVPSNQLRTACPAYDNKELLNVDREALTTAGSVPSKIRFLNEVPIASGCYYHADVVRSVIRNVFTAIVDLAERQYQLDLTLGVVRLGVKGQSLKASFAGSLKEKHNEPVRATPSLREPLSESWKKPEFSKSMENFLGRPKSREVHGKRLGTANLAIMGRDLTSCK